MIPILLVAGLLEAGSIFAAPAVLEETLANGLRVTIRPDPAKEAALSFVAIRCGSVDEPENLSGASHFLEHLLFNGTSRRTQEQIYAESDRLGAYQNATTREEHTLFQLLGPADRLVDLLDLQSDMILHSTLPEAKFEKERGIVIEEMNRDRSNEETLVDEAFRAELFRGLPSAKPVLGSVDSIRALKREDVLSYYRRHYVPSRMAVLVTGAVDGEKALALVKARFGEGPAATPHPRRAEAKPAWPVGWRLVRRTGGDDTTRVRIAFPAPRAGDADERPFRVLAEILSRRDGGPLSALVRPGGGVRSFSVGYEAAESHGTLTASAELETGADATVAAQALRRSLLAGWNPGMVRSATRAIDAASARLSDNPLYFGMDRAPALLSRRWSEVDEAESTEVDASRVATASARWLATARSVMVVSGPGLTSDTREGSDLPAVSTTWRGGPGVAPRHAGMIGVDAGGLARDPKVVLSSGLAVTLLEDPGASVFAAHVLVRHRSAGEDISRTGMTDLVHRLLSRGTLARDATGVAEALGEIGAELKTVDDANIPFDDYYTSPEYSFVRLEAPAAVARPALRLLRELLEHPRFEATEVARSVAEIGELQKREAASPRDVARRGFRSALLGGHPLARGVLGESRSLEGVTRDEVRAFHRTVLRPDRIILTLSGTSARELQAAAEAAFSDWKAPSEALVSAPTPPEVTAKAVRREAELGKPQGQMILGSILDVPEAQIAALRVAVMALSDRLAQDLRETQGLAYSIGAGISEAGGSRRLFSVSIGTGAANLEKAETAIRGHIARIASEGPSEDECGKVASSHAGRVRMRRLTSMGRAYWAAIRDLRGAPSDHDPEGVAAMQRVTAKQARAAAKKHLAEARLVVSVVR